MAVFISLVTDAFEDVFHKEVDKLRGVATRAGVGSARRPTRGLEIKEDTYAVIKVLLASGEEVPLLDSGSATGRSTSYTNFIIQAVNEARMEKMQIVETFGEDYVFFFGEQPRFLDVQAMLVTSNDFNWLSEFLANYELYLRGTRCAEVGARVYIYVDDIIVNGYMVTCQATRDATNPLAANLSFRLFETGYQIVSLVGDPNYPKRSSAYSAPLTRSGTDPTQYSGKIHENVDEWTGPTDLYYGGETEEDLSTLGRDHPDDLDKVVEERVAQSGGEGDNTALSKGLGIDDPAAAAGKGSFGVVSVPGSLTI